MSVAHFEAVRFCKKKNKEKTTLNRKRTENNNNSNTQIQWTIRQSNPFSQTILCSIYLVSFPSVLVKQLFFVLSLTVLCCGLLVESSFLFGLPNATTRLMKYVVKKYVVRYLFIFIFSFDSNKKWFFFIGFEIFDKNYPSYDVQSKKLFKIAESIKYKVNLV